MARTDVVGFIGFEPRIRDGSTPSALIIGPSSVGHRFQVDVIGFQLPAPLLGLTRVEIPARRDLPLSQSPNTLPMAKGGCVSYAVVAILEPDGPVTLTVATGLPSSTELAVPVGDSALAALAAGRPWLRLADVEIRLSVDGTRVFPTVVPALPATRCDDWRDFDHQLGGLPSVDDGTLLARSVRMFFANGGGRCQVATIRRPRFDDPVGLARALEDLVGQAGASEAEATGLEQLLRLSEVAIVDAPDLHCRRLEGEPRFVPVPPSEQAACFRPCDALPPGPGVVQAVGEAAAGAPVLTDEAVLDAQRALLRRCAPDRWRVALLLAAPARREDATGAWGPPNARQAIAWRQSLRQGFDESSLSCAALYHPWALTRERLGSPIAVLPPTPLAAGLLARRDLARGPHVAPANETLVGVVGLAPPPTEADNTALHAVAINPLRVKPGQGIQIWGARTLSEERWMRYLSVRRCLSAIERRALAALRPLVFEPISPTLWFQVTQAMLGLLVPIFNAGALRGDTAEEAFYVRCDDTNNESARLLAGEVLCEVGVAIAAPAEFIVFRLARRSSVVEVLE